MDEIFLKAALKKDAKLGELIKKTLSDGPGTSSEDENIVDSLEDSLPCDNINQESSSRDLLDVSSLEPEECDVAAVTFYFAETSETKDKECVTAHVKRLLKEAAKKRKENLPQPQRRMFTGKSIDVANRKGKKKNQEKVTETRSRRRRGAVPLLPPSKKSKKTL